METKSKMGKATVDEYLGGFDTSAKNRAGNPYQRYPDAYETYLDVRIYARPDGTRYAVETQVSRWGGVLSHEPGVVREIAEGKFPDYLARKAVGK
jgi:hypothetical protein